MHRTPRGWRDAREHERKVYKPRPMASVKTFVRALGLAEIGGRPETVLIRLRPAEKGDEE